MINYDSVCKLYGVVIPLRYLVWKGLIQLFGINLFRSYFICNYLGIGQDINLNRLLSNFFGGFRPIFRILPRTWLFERNLRQKLVKEMSFLMLVDCYRSYRHRRRLPCRGQRTSTNARTVKNIKSIGWVLKK